MPSREYYTVDRTPREIGELWEWASEECRGKLEHENPYAMGVLACMEYLMGETQQRPQDYKGLLTLKNVLRQQKKLQESGSKAGSGIDKFLDDGRDGFRPGNPKCLIYKAPLLSGQVVSGGDGAFNDGQDVLRDNPDHRGGERRQTAIGAEEVNLR